MHGIVLTNGETLIHSDELYHYGIKGQKWGVRRFQNKNGEYTQAGLKRYYDNKKTKLKESGDKAGLKQLRKDKSAAKYKVRMQKKLGKLYKKAGVNQGREQYNIDKADRKIGKYSGKGVSKYKIADKNIKALKRVRNEIANAGHFNNKYNKAIEKAQRFQKEKGLSISKKTLSDIMAKGTESGKRREKAARISDVLFRGPLEVGIRSNERMHEAAKYGGYSYEYDARKRKPKNKR